MKEHPHNGIEAVETVVTQEVNEVSQEAFKQAYNDMGSLQKLLQLSDTHFSQVPNKLEKNFFHGFTKYHLALHFI